MVEAVVTVAVEAVRLLVDPFSLYRRETPRRTGGIDDDEDDDDDGVADEADRVRDKGLGVGTPPPEVVRVGDKVGLVTAAEGEPNIPHRFSFGTKCLFSLVPYKAFQVDMEDAGPKAPVVADDEEEEVIVSPLGLYNNPALLRRGMLCMCVLEASSRVVVEGLQTVSLQFVEVAHT